VGGGTLHLAEGGTVKGEGGADRLVGLPRCEENNRKLEKLAKNPGDRRLAARGGRPFQMVNWKEKKRRYVRALLGQRSWRTYLLVPIGKPAFAFSEAKP